MEEGNVIIMKIITLCANFLKNMYKDQGWYKPLIPVLERQRQASLCEFEAILDHSVSEALTFLFSTKFPEVEVST